MHQSTPPKSGFNLIVIFYYLLTPEQNTLLHSLLCVYYTLHQGCQMVSFLYQKSQFGYIMGGLGTENVGMFYDHFEYFTAICYMLWQFGIVCSHLIHFFPFLFVWTKKNLATVCCTMSIVWCTFSLMCFIIMVIFSISNAICKLQVSLNHRANAYMLLFANKVWNIAVFLWWH
jgi:hypothetical protein